MFEILLACLSGIVVGYFIKTVLARRQRSSGTIYVTHKEEKTLYSLELDDYPESIEFKKTVVFKVDSSVESLDRE